MARAGSGDFSQRMRELEAAVGDGTLTGELTVDQVYAHIQHEALDFKHPHGGQAKYLEQPLLEGADGFMQRLADNAIQEDGSGLRRAMADNMERLSVKVDELAPVEFGDLRLSGHPTVKDGDITTYDRPPVVPRLTEQELRAKGHHRAHLLG